MESIQKKNTKITQMRDLKDFLLLYERLKNKNIPL
jgi:hypothetical protein